MKPIATKVKELRLQRDDFETLKIIGRGAFGEVRKDGKYIFIAIEQTSLFMIVIVLGNFWNLTVEKKYMKQ